jgi:hypothetical protein
MRSEGESEEGVADIEGIGEGREQQVEDEEGDCRDEGD